jgi:uncharacterized protein (DUF2141 family)
MTRSTLSICLLFFFLLAPGSGSATDVEVRLVGLEADTGQVWAAIYASAAAYAAGERLHGSSAPVEGDSVVLVFSGIAPGTYGINAFQDLNENDELDRIANLIPKEPYGFSHNARGTFGPPDFEDFSFTVGDDPVTLEIQLR